MKKLCHTFAVLAATVLLAGPAAAQDKSASHLGTTTSTNSAPKVPFSMKAEPTMSVGADVELTGLFVDFLQPQETWNLFNPALPAPVVKPLPDIPPLEPYRPSNDDLREHDAHFVVLSLHFR